MRIAGKSAVRNILANLVRGGATAAVALALPRFLTRGLDARHFAAWSLMLQIAAYASYLDFGLQIAIGRFIAQALELRRPDRQTKIIGTALFLLSLAGAFAFAVIAIVLWQLPHVFGGIGPGLLPEFRQASFLLSLSACLLLPLSTYTGVLIGMHRNEIPALAIGGSRIVGAVAAIAASRHTQSLSVLALCVGVPNLVGGLAQMAAVRRLLDQSRSSLRHISRSVARELVRFCASLTVWSFAMLVISGLDLTIVGHFQFLAVGFYSLASMVIVFLAGLTNSVLSALLAPLATLHAREDGPGMLKTLFLATRWTLLANLSFCAAVFFAGGPILHFWVGPAYAAGALPVLEVLAVAQTVRLVGGPFSVLLISIGEQQKCVAPAVCEACVNLAGSLLGVMWIGAIGVAWGTLAGAICSVAWIMVGVMPIVVSVRLEWRIFLTQAIVPAATPLLPMLAVWLARHLLGSTAYAFSLGVGLAATAALLWRFYRSNANRAATVL